MKFATTLTIFLVVCLTSQYAFAAVSPDAKDVKLVTAKIDAKDMKDMSSTERWKKDHGHGHGHGYKKYYGGHGYKKHYGGYGYKKYHYGGHGYGYGKKKYYYKHGDDDDDDDKKYYYYKKDDDDDDDDKYYVKEEGKYYKEICKEKKCYKKCYYCDKKCEYDDCKKIYYGGYGGEERCGGKVALLPPTPHPGTLSWRCSTNTSGTGSLEDMRPLHTAHAHLDIATGSAHDLGLREK